MIIWKNNEPIGISAKTTGTSSRITKIIMHNDQLREEQIKFAEKREKILKERQGLYKLRDKFTQKFTPEFINTMPLEMYAIGDKDEGRGENFCYVIERDLSGLGRILGSNAFKFGVYYGKIESDEEQKYRFAKKFGDSVEEAYENVRQEILNLLKDGKEENLDRIVKNKISPMFKGKILSSYYPERYLNIFSNEHLKHYLVQLNIDSPPELIKADPVYKRDALIEFKNRDEVMRDWSVDLFAVFLYDYYPRSPGEKKKNSNKGNDPLDDYRSPVFPKNAKPEWIDLELSSNPNQSNRSGSRGKSKSNPDYLKRARRLKELGNRGEKFVLDMERSELLAKGKEELSEKVQPAEFDYEGYDIKSFYEDGTPKYIEVKSTKAKPGNANFYLSINELNTAKELKQNYYVYIVFDVVSEKPKVWRVHNPFHPENKNVTIQPNNFDVKISVDKK